MTDLDDLTSVYSSKVHAVRTQITKFGEAYWDSMPNYRASAVEEMIDALVPRVTAGQLRIADLTRAYLARCAHELGWKLVVPPLDKTDVLGARGVDPRTVYRRPPRIPTSDARRPGHGLVLPARAHGPRELRPLRRRIDAALLQGRSAPDPSGLRLRRAAATARSGRPAGHRRGPPRAGPQDRCRTARRSRPRRQNARLPEANPSRGTRGIRRHFDVGRTESPKAKRHSG